MAKFKLSLKELNFEFEGDRDTGEKMQKAVNRTLGSLTDAQSQIIDVESKQVDIQKQIAESTSNGDTKSKKKRAKKSNKSDSAKKSSSSKSPLRPLLIRLVKEDFFSEPRQVSVVREELAKKGHNYESRGISSALLALTRDETIARDNSSGKWEYWRGTKDVSEES